MLALTPTAPPTLADLRQRMQDLYARLTLVERAVHGNEDPAWIAFTRLMTADLDAAEEALLQADLARTGGDTPRAKKRLHVAWNRLQEAGTRLGEWEAEHE